MKKTIICGLSIFWGITSSIAYTQDQPKAKAPKDMVAAALQAASQRNKKEAGDQALQKGPPVQYGLEDEEDIELEQKRKDVMSLVERGIDFFQKNTIQKACNVFTHTKDFLLGEAYLFVIDTKGNTFAHGENTNLLWQNVYDQKDGFGTFFIQRIIKVAQEGGGWVTYERRNAIKNSYAKEVKKDGKTYVIGAGYYPHSKKYAAVGLVKAAVGVFNQAIQEGRRKDEAFSYFSYPLGLFVFGDLYLYALDFKGNVMAQGDRPGLIGTNAWKYQDAKGKFLNQEIIKTLQDTNEGIWVDYVSKNAPKMAYAEKVQDAKGNSYFIACGYYPDANRKKARNLVQRAYQFVKRQGVGKKTLNEFTSKRATAYRYGDLYVFMYDMKGLSIAHGGTPDFVGKNHWNRQDDDGRYYVQELIKKAQDGGRGWVDVKLKNSFESIYVEKIKIGLEEYIIGSGVYPVSKKEMIVLLVKSGIGYLRTHEPEEAAREFTNIKGRFIRGDLNLLTLDNQGICYTYGTNTNMIWRNLLGLKDDNGKPYVQMLINLVKHGSGTVEYTLNGVPKVAYVQKVEKDGTEYIISSSYYKTTVQAAVAEQATEEEVAEAETEKEEAKLSF